MNLNRLRKILSQMDNAHYEDKPTKLKGLHVPKRHCNHDMRNQWYRVLDLKVWCLKKYFKQPLDVREQDYLALPEMFSITGKVGKASVLRPSKDKAKIWVSRIYFIFGTNPILLRILVITIVGMGKDYIEINRCFSTESKHLLSGTACLCNGSTYFSDFWK